MSHWPDIFEGDGSSAFESWSQTCVYFPGRGAGGGGEGGRRLHTFHRYI